MNKRKNNVKPSGLLHGILFLIVGGLILAIGSAPGYGEIKPESTDSFHYDAKNKVDPFKPFIALEVIKVSNDAKTSLKNVATTPLQQFGLEQIKVTGIAGSEDKRIALIEDPKGRGYIAHVGTLIGQNGGKVTGILKDRVIVEERAGKSKATLIVLKLNRDENEEKP